MHEQDRLSSVISLVFEDSHYSYSCTCSTCEETRSFLSAEDVLFINHISKTLATTKTEPRK